MCNDILDPMLPRSEHTRSYRSGSNEVAFMKTATCYASSRRIYRIQVKWVFFAFVHLYVHNAFEHEATFEGRTGLRAGSNNFCCLPYVARSALLPLTYLSRPSSLSGDRQLETKAETPQANGTCRQRHTFSLFFHRPLRPSLLNNQLLNSKNHRKSSYDINKAVAVSQEGEILLSATVQINQDVWTDLHTVFCFTRPTHNRRCAARM